MDELGLRRYPAIGQEKEHVVSWWRNMGISWSLDRQTAGWLLINFERHVSLIHIECVRHCSGSDQHGGFNSSFVFVAHLKGLVVSNASRCLRDPGSRPSE